MAEYLMKQEHFGDSSEYELEEFHDRILFFMWKTQQHPFSVLENGDTVYAVDGKERVIRWEFRVANLIKVRYESHIEAFGFLKDVFGLTPSQCTDYIWDRAPEGWLMAHSTDIIRPMATPIPKGFNFQNHGGGNGWVSLDKVSNDVKAKLDLPPVGSPSIFETSTAHTPDAVAGVKPEGKPDCFVPKGVKDLVLVRDTRRCRECGRDDEAMKVHFDHIYPYSKGGTNTPNNIQILCDKCNLSKGAKIRPGVERPDDAWDADDYAKEEALIKKLRADSKAGDVSACFALAPKVPDEEALGLLLRVADSDHTAIKYQASAEVAEIYSVRGELSEAKTYAEAARSGDDPVARDHGTICLSRVTEPGPDSNAILEEALASDLQWVRSEAALNLVRTHELPPARTRQLLEEAMKTDVKEDRGEAAYWLALITEDLDEKEQLLFEALGSSDPLTTDFAKYELVGIYLEQGIDSAALALLKQVQDSDDLELAALAREEKARFFSSAA